MTFIVGDVHGCVDELQALVRLLEVKSTDQLVFVGDLVAKGPDSQGVVQLARELKALAVKGNHDAHVLKFRAGQPLKKHHEQVAGSLTEADWRYLEAMPLWLELPELDALVVHGGLLPGVPLSLQKADELLNMRSIDAEGKASKRVDGGVPWASRWRGPRHAVFGHDAIRGLQQWPMATGLDTGCVYGKRLTALVLPERRLVSVPAKKVWSAVESD